MKEAGEIYIIDPDKDRYIETIPTLQCVHCGGHWQCKIGSGNVRGFCYKCKGPICGPKCQKCVPLERQFENTHKGRPKLWLPSD